MRKIKILMSVAVVLATMVSTAGTSYASTDDGMANSAAPIVIKAGDAAAATCPEGAICLYANAGSGSTSQSGFMWWAGQSHTDFTKLFCNVDNFCYTNNDFNDEASSWHNNTNMTYCVSWGIQGGNPDNTMPPRSRGNFTSAWNDKASSLGFLGCP